jgi:hypothetical protein
MPVFRVEDEQGYWDGVHKHPRGTLLQIEPQDYDRLLSLAMTGMDPEAKKALVDCRKRWAPKDRNGNTIELPRFLETTSGELNPNDLDDLRAMTPKGATLVHPDVTGTPAGQKVHVPQTASKG